MHNFGHRIDAEASSLRKKLDGMMLYKQSSGEGHEKVTQESTIATLEVILILVLY